MQARTKRIHYARKTTRIALVVAGLLLSVDCQGSFFARPDHADFQKFSRGTGQDAEAALRSLEDALGELDAERPGEYRLGPGDEISIQSRGNEQLSGSYTLDPGGDIVLYPALEVNLDALTRREAETQIARALRGYYRYPQVTLSVARYANNHAYVLGRVLNPGKISLAGRTRLLDALSQAGIRRSADQNLRIGRCAIVRGNRRILWLDLNELLERGNLALNLQLAPGDVVYVPDPGDRFVYVLGEVNRPGGYFMSPGHSLLRAIGDAGGLTEDADTSAIRVVRDSTATDRDEAVTATIDLGDITGDGVYARNFALAPEDVIYVPRRGVAKFNYYLRMLNPFAQVFVIGNALKNSGN